MDFETIVLTDSQFKLLELLEVSVMPFDSINMNDFNRLKHHRLVDTAVVVSADDLTRRLGYKAVITQTGRDYLAWRASKRRDRRAEFWKSVLLLLIGSLIALLLPKLAALLPKLELLFQGG